MLVMDVRIVCVAMFQRLVAMRVRVRLIATPVEIMCVLVVAVVTMVVNVLQRRMLVGVFMVFGQVQPHAGRHQHRRHPEGGGGRFVEHGHCDDCTHERRGRKIGPGARGPKAPQREYEEH